MNNETVRTHLELHDSHLRIAQTVSEQEAKHPLPADATLDLAEPQPPIQRYRSGK